MRRGDDRRARARVRRDAARRRSALNYGLQRHAGGGNAVRAIACLPALIGAWRDPAGGALLSSSGTYPVDTAALERPDLIRGRAAHDQHEHDRRRAARRARPAGRARSTSTTRTRWPSRPTRRRCAAGFARDDLFCVVHEIFQTDTADYADILLPATTQLEHLDIHHSYGHLYVLANNCRRSRRWARRCPTPRSSACSPRAWASTEPCFRDSDEDLARQAFRRDDPRAAGLDWDTLQGARLRSGSPCRSATRRSPKATSRRRRASASSTRRRSRRRATIRCRLRPAARIGREQSGARAALSAGVHLAAGAQLPQLVVRQPAGVRRRGRRAAPRHPSRRRGGARASPTASACASSTTAAASPRRRASPTARGRASSSRRRSGGRSSRPDGANANAVTGQALTDLGRAATFYDCLVEVERA